MAGIMTVYERSQNMLDALNSRDQQVIDSTLIICTNCGRQIGTINLAEYDPFVLDDEDNVVAVYCEEEGR